jgi:transcriptional regulator with XRE-family HTH domain
MAEMRITGAQIRAARAFLRWTISDLADRAGVGSSTVQAIERTDGEPSINGGLGTTLEYRSAARDESLAKIASALTKAGITFLPDDGKSTGLRRRNKSR